MIARYKVATEDAILLTARKRGKLILKDGCLSLAVEGEPKPYILALPISDDKSQWQMEFSNGQLFYEGEYFQLGEKLDLGGGFMKFSSLVVKPKGCEGEYVWAGYITRSLSKK